MNEENYNYRLISSFTLRYLFNRERTEFDRTFKLIIFETFHFILFCIFFISFGFGEALPDITRRGTIQRSSSIVAGDWQNTEDERNYCKTRWKTIRSAFLRNASAFEVD